MKLIKARTELSFQGEKKVLQIKFTDFISRRRSSSSVQLGRKLSVDNLINSQAGLRVLRSLRRNSKRLKLSISWSVY